MLCPNNLMEKQNVVTKKERKGTGWIVCTKRRNKMEGLSAGYRREDSKRSRFHMRTGNQKEQQYLPSYESVQGGCQLLDMGMLSSLISNRSR